MLNRYRTALMEEVDSTTGGTTASVVTPPAPAARAAGEEYKDMTPEQFKARVAEAVASGESRTLRALGVKSPDEIKNALTELQKLKDAQLSEQERAKKQIDELAPQAARAVKLLEAVQTLLATEEKLVPEDKKGLLDLAPPADQPEARLQWIANAKAKGLFGAPATASVTAPDAAAVVAAAAAARPANPATTIGQAGPTPPAPTGTKTELQQYEDYKARGLTRLAAQHYERYGTLIDQQRAGSTKT